MEPPYSLASCVYVLAFDPRRRRLRRRGHFGYLVRVAALTDLHLRGVIHEVDGIVAVRGGAAGRMGDPILEALAREVESARRKWDRLVTRNARRSVAAVRDHAVSSRVVEIESWLLGGLIRRERPVLADWRMRDQLAARVATAVAGGAPHPPRDHHGARDHRDAALAALLVVGGISQAFPTSEWKALAKRTREFADRGGPATQALLRRVEAERHAPVA